MHLRMPTDRAGLPVMWLRHTDGKMRRDGVRAALLKRPCAVAERGRLHGASGLMTIAAHRVMAWIRAACRKRERKREWLRSERRHDRLRRQDKRRKVRAVGRAGRAFKISDLANIADHPAQLAIWSNPSSLLNFRHPVSLRCQKKTIFASGPAASARRAHREPNRSWRRRSRLHRKPAASHAAARGGGVPSDAAARRALPPQSS
ncbi:hypothetical protein ACVWYQ_003479 [Bradyrhizobium sp. USDA 3397]